MLGIFWDTVYRAYLNALGFFIPAYAFGAMFPIYYIDVIPFRNCFIRALRFAYTAVYTIFVDQQ